MVDLPVKLLKILVTENPSLPICKYFHKRPDKEAVNSVQINKEENQNKVIYGDILFTTSSETPDEIGMSEVFLGTDWSPYLNSFCFGLRLEKPSPIYPLFAKYLFRGRKFRHDIRPLAQGSTRFNLSKGYLGKLSLLIPPLPEQKKIASILTSVDEVIEKTQSQIDKLQDLKKGTMNELLTRGIGHTEFKDSELGRIPKSWEVMHVGKFAKNVNKKFQPFKNSEIKKYIGLEHIWSKKNNIKGFDYSSNTTSTKTEFKKGDILFGKLRPYLKKVVIAGFDGVSSTDILCIRPELIVHSEFLFYTLSSDRTIKYTMEGAAYNMLEHHGKN